MGRVIFLSYFATSKGWKEFAVLLPGAEEFEKQCLLYFRFSDWPITLISWQPLNHFLPSHFLVLTLTRLAAAPGVSIAWHGYQDLTNACWRYKNVMAILQEINGEKRPEKTKEYFTVSNST